MFKIIYLHNMKNVNSRQFCFGTLLITLVVIVMVGGCKKDGYNEPSGTPKIKTIYQPGFTKR